MGTRALVHFYDNETELACIYRQYDGYPTGLGDELAELLKPFTVVNGLSPSSEGKIANGPGCLAAQIIAALKDRPGNVYLYPPGISDVGEEYVYKVRAKGGEILFECLRPSGKVKYSGPPKDFVGSELELAPTPRTLTGGGAFWV